MLYQVESYKTQRAKKLIIVYVIILLLVLLIAIWLGIYVAKKYNENKIKEQQIGNVERFVEKGQEEQSKGVKSKTEESNQNVFVKNIDDIYNGKEGKRVFLTFDDGPSQAVTPHILDTLKKYDIKATFFVLGSRVNLNPDLIKREYEEGHYIANHSYSHQYSKIYKSSKSVLEEYNKTEKEIQKALQDSNYSSNLFRFPGGSIGGEYSKIKQQTKKELQKNNIAYLDWNALTNDAAGANTKEKIMSNLKQTVSNKNNVVILMHDAPDKILTYETLEDVIKYLKQNGYTFKNMYDLMEAGK